MRHLPRFMTVLACLWAAPTLAAAPATATPVPAACEDFHAHVHAGAAVASAEATAGEAGAAAPAAAPHSLFATLQAQSLQRQRLLLDELATAAEPTPLATFWRAAMDEAAIEAAGTRALAPWLERVAEIRKPRDVAALLAAAHAAGLPLLFRFDVGADLREPGRSVAYARQGGLALPDRDYYLREDPATQALLAHYRAYVGRLLTLLGTPAASLDAAVASVLDIEQRLARASLSQVQLRDPNNSWMPASVKDVQGRYANLDFKGFLKTLDQRRLPGLSLAHTAFFVEADHLVGSLTPAQWQPYLRFHLAHALAPHLPRAFREAHHAFFGGQLQGRMEPTPHWQLALQATDAALGEALGQHYAQRWLGEAQAGRARALAVALVQALTKRVSSAAWLGEEARAAGAAKLAALEVEIGHAAPLPERKLPALSAAQHAANVLAMAAWRQQVALSRLGEPPRPAPLHGHRVQAFYDPAGNRLAVSAAFLAPPLWLDTADAARDAATLGTLLGHELSHAVDPQGAMIGADGRAGAWWSAEDYQRFTTRSQALVPQYDAYPALSDVRVHGRRTFIENVADLAGLELAWDVLQAGGPVDPEAARRFFTAFATLWPTDGTAASQRLALATDLHAPPRWRVLGPLANFAPFASTFGCTPGSGFVRAPAERIAIWH